MAKKVFEFPTDKIEIIKESKVPKPQLVGHVLGIPIYTDLLLKPNEVRILVKDEGGNDGTVGGNFVGG